MQNKNHMVISTGEEKAFDKIEYLVYVENPEEIRNRITIPQHNKGYI
jgi:hypothetical protein